VGVGKTMMLRGKEDICWCYLTVHPDARAGDAGPSLLEAIGNRVLARRRSPLRRRGQPYRRRAALQAARL
jgi:hypothetical protein